MTREVALKSHVPITMVPCHWNHINYYRFFSLENLGMRLKKAESSLSQLLNKLLSLAARLGDRWKELSCSTHHKLQSLKCSPFSESKRLSISLPHSPNIQITKKYTPLYLNVKWYGKLLSLGSVSQIDFIGIKVPNFEFLSSIVICCQCRGSRTHHHQAKHYSL